MNEVTKMAEEKDEQQARLDATLSKIKNRLLVFSGKGGVGKSTVAANLGLALANKGLQVGLLDVDIHGPNLAKMLGVEGKRMEAQGANRILPVSVNGNLKVVSMAFLLENPDLPVIWRGPLKMSAIRQFISDVDWGELDWLIVDSPPGTGDEPLSVAQLVPATGAVVVTTPQEVSLLDSRKAVTFARRLGLEVVGVVENMSGLTCPHCGGKIDLFKEGGGERIAREMEVPFLGRVPIDPGIVQASDSGRPFLVDNPESESAKAFHTIVDKILGGKR
jgi:ATP-binding protein involved in chromosome partitioning